ncbi:MAG TPA: copper resistance CopC family protein [Gemmatimonadales bacterium]|nr:copper resistance CopC family protein [Gemmatimonadales bacterium]
MSRSILPIVALLLIGAGGNATQHLRLTGTSPAKDSTVAESPSEIRLSFSLKPELALVRISLASASGTKVAMGKPARTADSLTVSAPVEETLAAGGYSVSWQAASSDGHPIRGTFGFTVASAAATQPAAAPSATTISRDHSSHR